MSSQFQMKWPIEGANAGMLVKEFLKKEEISRTALTDIKFNGGKILVNNEEVMSAISCLRVIS